VTELERRYVADAAENDWYAAAGQSVPLFEREFADYIGVAYAAAVPHCTAALHLSLLALGVGPGDEVVVPESTWVATAAPIMYVGATPVFADIEPDTWCLSATSLAGCVTQRTKAVITVDLYGGVPDMDAIRSVTEPRGIAIIEDAAQSIGATWKGVAAGALGDIATFSFHGTKTLTTGEGGMLVTDRVDLFERVARQRDHGRGPGDHKFFVTGEVGQKYRMSSLQAAFGRAQLSRVDELLAKKAQLFSWYYDRLHDIVELTFNVEPPGTHNAFWMTNVVVDASRGLGTLDLMARFDAEGIDTRPFFPPLSSLGAFAALDGVRSSAERNSVAYDLSLRSINLPSALMLTEGDVDRVCSVFRRILDDAGKEHA
jgi:perosamine synthetase